MRRYLRFGVRSVLSTSFDRSMISVGGLIGDVIITAVSWSLGAMWALFTLCSTRYERSVLVGRGKAGRFKESCAFGADISFTLREGILDEVESIV
jgi:hypothetical protein